MPEYLKIILAVALVAALLGIFLVTYLINRKVKAPDDCPKADIGCAGCMLNCSKREEELSVSKLTDNLVGNFRDEGSAGKTDKR